MNPNPVRSLFTAISCSLVIGATCSAQTNIIGDYTTTKTPSNFVGPNSALGNGDFQAQALTGAQPFSVIANWHNLDGLETVTFGQSTSNNGSPQSASLGAQLSGTTYPANDTPYTITSAGQVFSVNMYLGQVGTATLYGLDTTVTVNLFTSTTGVTDTTVPADITVLGSRVMNPFNPSSATFLMQGGTVYTTVAGDIGKVVYMGIKMVDTGNDAFPRLDVVSLSVAQQVLTPAITVVTKPSVIAVQSPATAGTGNFTIRNDSASSVTVNSFSGLSGTGFTITSPSAPFPIAAGATQVITVQWNSATASPATFQHATLAINSTDTVSPTTNVGVDGGIATPYTAVLPNGNFETPGTDNVTWADTFASWIEFDSAFSKPNRVKNVPGLITAGTAAYLDRSLLNPNLAFDATTNPYFGGEIHGNFSTRLNSFEITADFAINSAGTNSVRKFNMIVTAALATGQNVNIRYQGDSFAARDLAGAWITVIDTAALGGALLTSTDGDLDGSLDNPGAGDIKNAYKLKLTGTGWGTSNPSCVLQVLNSAGTSIATSAPFSIWRTAAPTDGNALADQVTFAASFDNAPRSWVDNVAVNGLKLDTAANYAGWASDNAGGQASNLDYDNDGVMNGVEYFMGAIGSSFTTNPSVVGNTVTWPKGPAFSGTYTVQTSINLVNWSNVTSSVVGNTVVYTLPPPPGKVFVRLDVTPN